MADMLLDGTVLRGCVEGDERALNVFRRIADGAITASISPVTVVELWGAPDLDRKAEIRYAAILSFLEEAPLSVPAARTAGIWLASLGPQAGGGALVSRALVAATAKEREEPICTRAADSFSQFDCEMVEL